MENDQKQLNSEKPFQFLADEEGAVTVDWVVLTAAVVGMAAATASTINDATSTLSTSIGNEIGTKSVSNGD